MKRFDIKEGEIEMKNDLIIREYEPGDPSRVVYFYYKLYEKQYKFNGSVERYFMNGMVELFDNPADNQMWIVEKNEKIVGSIAVIKKGEHEAQLRWFGVDTSLQGMGIGNKLLDIAMEFCREHEYSHVILWTIDILQSARHLYAKYGFVLTDTKPNFEWADYKLLEEKWEFSGNLLNNEN